MVNFKMSRGPNSLIAGVAAAPEEKEGSAVSTRCRVEAPQERGGSPAAGPLLREAGAGHRRLAPRGVAWLHPTHPLVSNKGYAHITLEGGADCVLRGVTGIPRGSFDGRHRLRRRGQVQLPRRRGSDRQLRAVRRRRRTRGTISWTWRSRLA